MDYIAKLIENYKQAYSKIGLANIMLNRHMNDLTEITFTQSNMNVVLNVFVNTLPEIKSNIIINILTCLTNHAKNTRLNLIQLSELDYKIVDAILVDFINYVGYVNCVDYGIYSLDLTKEKPTKHS